MYYHGMQLCHFNFGLLFKPGSTFKGKNLLSSEQILSFKSRRHFNNTLPRCFEKLYPFENMAESRGGITVNLNVLCESKCIANSYISQHYPLPVLITTIFPTRLNSCCCIVVLRPRSVNVTTLFLGRLRPPKRLTSTSCTYFRQ